MINIATENLLTLPDAAKRLPRRRRDRPVHVSTLYRWISRGVRGVRLEAVQIGGSLYVSQQSLQRFADCLTVVNSACASNQPKRAAPIETKIDEALDAAGF